LCRQNDNYIVFEKLEAMCKEMPVIPVNRVVDPKRIIKKTEGQEGGEAQGVADPKKETSLFHITQDFCSLLGGGTSFL
jgi:hypothetical protein